jgi:hypothetical protein
MASASLVVRNLAPVGVPDSFSATEGVPLVLAAPGVLANDRDFDALSAVLLSPPTRGTLTLGSDGSLRYVANAGSAGTDTFAYEARDDVAGSGPIIVTIAIAPATSGLDAVDDAFVIAKRRHRPHVLAVLANDRPAAGALKIVRITQPAQGRVTLSPDRKSVVYQAPKRFRGATTFTYTIKDASGRTDTATVTVTVARKPGHGNGHHDHDGHGGGHGDHDDDDDDDDDRGDCDGRDH